MRRCEYLYAAPCRRACSEIPAGSSRPRSLARGHMYSPRCRTLPKAVHVCGTDPSRRIIQRRYTRRAPLIFLRVRCFVLPSASPARGGDRSYNRVVSTIYSIVGIIERVSCSYAGTVRCSGGTARGRLLGRGPRRTWKAGINTQHLVRLSLQRPISSAPNIVGVDTWLGGGIRT
ncbi:hypothetical protein HYPSUDRAFT_441355 [Hypholoma sublateritium FD-334 SS-4]|uniref:Uncharacterized protein n=1 Tax=Hypholoma sublateritium (strain FD-334 SS-4) TaxID=945553 RepID=A0A0D2P9H4_HYPSF|nr:hypothetical protein HYPSUDRAFT_441355 [Hypholoma sublateritium FD-334 SS-4]